MPPDGYRVNYIKFSRYVDVKVTLHVKKPVPIKLNCIAFVNMAQCYQAIICRNILLSPLTLFGEGNYMTLPPALPSIHASVRASAQYLSQYIVDFFDISTVAL